MKAAILHRGGRIRDKIDSNTIGFNACIGQSLSNGKIKYLNEEQAHVLRVVNGLRDAEQHYHVTVSEEQLYVHIQSGVTLFREVLKDVFSKELTDYLPNRVLPVSTSPPVSIETLFDSEVAEITKLLAPNRRQRVEAFARLRALSILEKSLTGDVNQPTNDEMGETARELLAGEPWSAVFPGVATIEINAEGSELSLSLRISKKEGTPVRVVPEGTPSAPVVLKRVNELDYYCLGAKQIAHEVELTLPKTVAVIHHLGLANDSEYYREFALGKVPLKRYSRKTIDRIKASIKEESLDEIWANRPDSMKGSRQKSAPTTNHNSIQ